MDLRIERLVALMKADLSQRLPLSRMAQLVNLSSSRLCYLFESETGMSASRYLKSLRMKEATALLSTTFLSVKEIMVRVGFADESHFVKDFKKIYGLTPTEYRKSKANDDGEVAILRATATGVSVSVSRAVTAGRTAHLDGAQGRAMARERHQNHRQRGGVRLNRSNEDPLIRSANK
jgi:AraC-like DNA-binding protein